MGSQGLSFCVELKAPFTSKSTSEEEETFGKTQVVGQIEKRSKALVRKGHPPRT